MGPADSYTTMSNELTLKEAALAWAQGKKVEAIGPSNVWGLIQQVGSSDGMWQPGVFSGDSCRVFHFRLAPEPPAKRYRPWTADEVPVGVKMREKECEGWFTPACGGGREIEVVVDGEISKVKLTDLALHYEFSEDNGKTWLPCGVEVEA